MFARALAITIAIIVSLIYVGVQLRHSTQAARVITSQAFVQTHCGVSPLIQEPEFRDIYWWGLAGSQNRSTPSLKARTYRDCGEREP